MDAIFLYKQLVNSTSMLISGILLPLVQENGMCPTYLPPEPVTKPFPKPGGVSLVEVHRAQIDSCAQTRTM